MEKKFHVGEIDSLSPVPTKEIFSIREIDAICYVLELCSLFPSLSVVTLRK